MAAWEEAQKKARKIKNSLTLEDPETAKKFNRNVHVANMDDGSSWYWVCAYVEKWEGWYLVFPEHDREHCFPICNDYIVRQMMDVPIEDINDVNLSKDRIEELLEQGRKAVEKERKVLKKIHRRG